MTALQLDDYEVCNLREGLLFLRGVGGDTGDWLGQILNKLPAIPGSAPNKSVQQQRRDMVSRSWFVLALGQPNATSGGEPPEVELGRFGI